MTSPPKFDDAFQQQLTDLFKWRRDVRRFRTDALDPALVDEILRQALLAPSVGNSQPWRYIHVVDPARRLAIRDNFEACNQEALADYHGEKAKTYAALKLSGLDRAPVHLAVFCDTQTKVGHGLGQKTMPESLKYSVVSSIQTLWLSARARGVGVGWVSIIEPDVVKQVLDVKQDSWDLVAYLCVGYPEEEHIDPELIRHDWQQRLPYDEQVFKR